MRGFKSRTESLRAVQWVLGVKEDLWYGPVTMKAMRAWQAKHLPELPEVHRGYLTQHFWLALPESTWEEFDKRGWLEPEEPIA